MGMDRLEALDSWKIGTTEREKTVIFNISLWFFSVISELRDANIRRRIYIEGLQPQFDMPCKA